MLQIKTIPKTNNYINANSTKTNKNGFVCIVPGAGGEWYIATIYMERRDDVKMDYKSNLTTLTFEIK